MYVWVVIVSDNLVFSSYDTIKRGWNVMIDSWGWLVIGWASASARPRYNGFTPPSLLHRRCIQITSARKWQRLYPEYFVLIFCTVGRSGDASTIFIHSLWFRQMRLIGKEQRHNVEHPPISARTSWLWTKKQEYIWLIISLEWVQSIKLLSSGEFIKVKHGGMCWVLHKT